MKIKAQFIHLRDSNPLLLLLGIGLVLRMISVLFSAGFYAHDDHYLVIQVAQDWLEGYDSANWFVPFEEATSGRALLYPGFHFALFSGLEGIGIESPTTKMFIVRLIHALYSLLIIYYGYKITLLLSNKKTAFYVGLILATLWLLPFIGVRNLVEIVVAPPLMAAAYLIIKPDRGSVLRFLWVGVLLGISFSLRYQVALVGIGFIIGMIIDKQWRNVLITSIGGIIWVGIFHGYGDYIATGVPFGKVIYYLTDNLVHATSYFKQPWYDFILLMLAFLIPPISILFIFGTAISYRINKVIFLGVALFFFLHSLFPNKQERFIFSVLPFFVILGFIAFEKFKGKSKFWSKRPKLIKSFWIVYIVLNTIALVLISPFSSKKSRVDVMSYLYEQGDASAVIIDNSDRNATNGLPTFYAGKRLPLIKIDNTTPFDQLSTFIDREGGIEPNYILFEVYPEQKVSEERLLKYKRVYPKMQYKKTIVGSNGDRIRFKMNKIVNNYEYEVYKIN